MVRIVDRRISRGSIPVGDDNLDWDAMFETRLRELVREEVGRRLPGEEVRDHRAQSRPIASRYRAHGGPNGTSLQELLEELVHANARSAGHDYQGGREQMSQYQGNQQQGGQQATMGGMNPQQGISEWQLQQLVAQLAAQQGASPQNQPQGQNGQGAQQGGDGAGASVQEMLHHILGELRGQQGQQGQQGSQQQGQQGQQGSPQQGQQGQQGSPQQQQSSFQDQLRNALQQLVGGGQGQSDGHQQGGQQQGGQQGGGQQQQGGGQQGLQPHTSLAPQQLSTAHAQVSEQLANNLRKLKQVIAETQQIAYKMEMILAQEEKRSGKSGGSD